METLHLDRAVGCPCLPFHGKVDSIQGRALSFVAISLIGILIAASAVARPLQSAKPKAVGMSQERLAHLDEVIQSAIARDETPGAVVLVARKGKVVYKKAFGYRALLPKREPMTVNTIFDLASLTKVVVTATAIMILVEEGKITLTDRVEKYFPEFARHGKGVITPLNLLTHYSGLRPDIDLDQPWSGYDTALAKVCDEKLEAAPGERFIYSDINYLVLAELVRRVGGENLQDFVAARVLKPLGMNETIFNPGAQMVPRIAPTQIEEGVTRGQVNDPTAFRMGGVSGHAGLFSTVEDTAIYSQMILNGGIYNGVRVLSPLSVLKMTTRQSPQGALEWRGLGFDLRSRFSGAAGDVFPVGSFGHTGFTGTSVWMDPYTQTQVILFTNRLHPGGKGDVTSLRKKVASVVAASIVDNIPSLLEPYHRH